MKDLPNQGSRPERSKRKKSGPVSGAIIKRQRRRENLGKALHVPRKRGTFRWDVSRL